MTTIEVTGLDDSDVKSKNGWKKAYKVSLAGMVNGVSIAVTLKCDDLDTLEEIVPFDKKAQRKIIIEPVNHTLTTYPGGSGQNQLTEEQQEEQDQDEEHRQLMRELTKAKGND